MSAKKRTSARLQKAAREIQAETGKPYAECLRLAASRLNGGSGSAGPGGFCAGDGSRPNDPSIELFARINQISYAAAADEFDPATGEPKYLTDAGSPDDYHAQDQARLSWAQAHGFSEADEQLCLHALGDEWGERCVDAFYENASEEKCGVHGGGVWDIGSHRRSFVDSLGRGAAITLHPHGRWDSPHIHAELREMAQLFGLRFRIGFANDRHYGHGAAPIVLLNPVVSGEETSGNAVLVDISAKETDSLEDAIKKNIERVEPEVDQMLGQIRRGLSTEGAKIPRSTALDIIQVLKLSTVTINLPWSVGDAALDALDEALEMEIMGINGMSTLNAKHLSIQAGDLDPEKLRQAISEVEQQTGIRAELVGLRREVGKVLPTVVDISEVGEDRSDAHLGLHGPTRIVRQVISEMMQGPTEGAFVELERIVDLRRRFSEALAA